MENDFKSRPIDEEESSNQRSHQYLERRLRTGKTNGALVQTAYYQRVINSTYLQNYVLILCIISLLLLLFNFSLYIYMNVCVCVCVFLCAIEVTLDSDVFSE